MSDGSAHSQCEHITTTPKQGNKRGRCPRRVNGKTLDGLAACGFHIAMERIRKEALEKPCSSCGEFGKEHYSSPSRGRESQCRDCARTRAANHYRKKTNFGKLSLRPCSRCQTEFAPADKRSRLCSSCAKIKKEAWARQKVYRATSGTVGVPRASISPKEWDVMLAVHNGKCWICKESAGDNIDHCHKTGKIRGPLCHACNVALHYVENKRWWARASLYLDGAL